MLSIKRSKVPAYLRESDFYKSLSEEDDEEITIPKCNMKQNTKVSSAADLVHMFSTCRFWGLSKLPEPALKYAMFSCDEETFSQIEEFEDVNNSVACLRSIRFADGEEKVLQAAKFGRIHFICYLLHNGHFVRAEAAVQAASNNHLECLEFITGILLDRVSKPYKQLALHQLPSTMNYCCWKHLHGHGAKLDRGCVAKAASEGNLSCLQYIHESKGKVTKGALETAVENNHVPCVAFIHEVCKIALDVDYAVVAAARGHLDCLKYLFEHGCPRANRVCNAPAQANNLECLKYAHEQGCNMNRTTMFSAKSLECIKYLHEKKVNWDHRIYSGPLRANRQDWLQYFHDEGLLCSSGAIDHTAACTGGGESLRFLYERGAGVQVRSVQGSILVCDNLACLKVVLEYDYQPTAEDCAIAASCGALRCLQHLHEAAGCPWNVETCTRAAKSGRLNTLQYAVQHGCPADEATTEAAASQRGTVECMKYLHEAGCPWDARTALAAVGQYSGISKLQYAHENGCPWDENICIQAVTINNLEILTYAHAHGCPWSADTFAAAVEHAGGVRRELLYYLHEQGCPWDERVCSVAAGKGYLDVRKYAHSHGCPWSVETCNAAATQVYSAAYKYYNGSARLQCLQFLHGKGCPWDVTTANTAALTGDLMALKYLFEQGCPCDATTCAAAASCKEHGCQTLQYLREHHVPWDEATTRAAAANCHRHNLQYALEHGCPAPLDEICTIAARAKSAGCLQYAHKHGCSWDHNTYQAAVESGATQLATYMHSQGCPRTAEETAALAAQKAWERAKVKQETSTSAEAPSEDDSGSAVKAEPIAAAAKGSASLVDVVLATGTQANSGRRERDQGEHPDVEEPFAKRSRRVI